MTQALKITYDRAANALYIYVRDAESVSQREYSKNVILDLAADGGLVGIEVLDPGADLKPLVNGLGLDPQLADVLDRIRGLIPLASKELVFA